MTQTSHDISTLNGLIASTFDSVDGYIAAADDTRSGRLGELFRARAYERGVVAHSFQVQVSRLGGKPEHGGTLGGGAHRAFMTLKGAVTGNGVQALVSEVERGEDRIKARFETALNDNMLSAPVKA
ncbi:MAG: PA2169 family four-helix-bundle protein, partial [Sphingomonas sp.]